MRTLTKALARHLAITGLLAVLGLAGCANKYASLSQQMTPRLRVGMSEQEAQAALAEFRPHIIGDQWWTIGSEDDLLDLHGRSLSSRDALTGVDVGTPVEVITFSLRSSHWDAASVLLFFDDRTHLLRAWASPPGDSGELYRHERLTSQLQASETGIYKGSSRKDVIAKIGPPTGVVPMPDRSRASYDDTY